MSTLALYQIASEYRQMVEKLMESGDDQQSIADTIEAESYPLEVKAQNVAYAIRNMDVTVEAMNDAIESMIARRNAMQRRAKSIRNYLQHCMEVAGVNKIECPHFAIALRKCPPKVVVFEPGLLPTDYMTKPQPPEPEPDKEAIKQAIKAGKIVPGAQMVQGTRLDIK